MISITAVLWEFSYTVRTDTHTKRQSYEANSRFTQYCELSQNHAYA